MISPGGSDPKFRRKRAHLDKKKRWGPSPLKNSHGALQDRVMWTGKAWVDS